MRYTVRMSLTCWVVCNEYVLAIDDVVEYRGVVVRSFQQQVGVLRSQPGRTPARVGDTPSGTSTNLCV